MNYFGIDPGSKGGWAVLGDDQDAGAMPMVGKEIDAYALAAVLNKYRPSLVVVERAQAMPRQGVSSMFNYGKGFGKILGVLEAGCWSHQLVTPQQWKRSVLAGTAKDKFAAINHCHRRYPMVDLVPGRARKPQDGIADAVCMAEYAMTKASQNGLQGVS